MPKKAIAIIEDIIFMNKQNIPWNQVEQYLKRYYKGGITWGILIS